MKKTLNFLKKWFIIALIWCVYNLNELLKAILIVSMLSLAFVFFILLVCFLIPGLLIFKLLTILRDQKPNFLQNKSDYTLTKI